MKIRRFTALLLAAALVFLCSACRKSTPSNAGKKILYPLSADPVTLDPQIAADTPSLIAIRSLFEGLTRLGADGSAQPGAAKTWEANADSTEFTFHLRTDARWSLKKYGAVTAQDFVYAFRRALDPATGSTTCQQIYCIKNAREVHAGALSAEQLGAEAKDAETLVVRLAYSCPDFPKVTAAAVCMPCCEKFFTETAGRYGLDTACVLGNGPFAIDGDYGWEHDKHLNLTASARYGGEHSPLPSDVDFTISADTDSLSSLKNGTADAAPVSSSQTESAQALGCTLVSFQDTVWGLCFNTKSDVFQNEKARCAFTQAFSREKVLAHIPGNDSAADNILLPDTMLGGKLYRAQAGGPFYLKQSDKAASTLAAGLAELKLESIPSITVLCPDDAGMKLMVNEMLAAWNQQFSNYFNMEPLSADKLKSRVSSGDYDLAVCSIHPAENSPLAALSLFTGASANNPAQLKDSSYDALVAAAEGTGENKSAAAYAAAEKYLNEKAIFYPLCYEKSYYASAKGVTGIVFLPFMGGVDFIGAGKES